VEITFKLLYEETESEVKLNDHPKEDMTAVLIQRNLKGLWEYSRKDHISKVKIHTEV
jgi:hypothetical protein